MRALVTGGGGFIGSNIVERLLARGDDVRVMDNFSTGKRENLASLDGEVELIEGDLRSYERVHNAVRGCEVVFHQGALPSVPRSVQDPITSSDVNVGGTLNVLLAARDEGVRRVVFASSSSIYGDLPGLPRVEAMPVSPAAPYAVSKLAAEHYCHVASKVYGLETVSLRYFNIFGKRQDPLSQYSAVIPKFIAALRAGRSPDDPRHRRAVARLHPHRQRRGGQPAGRGRRRAPPASASTSPPASRSRSTTSSRLLNTLMDTDITADYGDPRPGDVEHSLADITQAREVLGYEPTVGFEDGLQMTIEAFDRDDRAPGLPR